MSNPSKNATFKALIDAVVTELMFKTTGDQVYLNDTTTVSAKIAEIVAAINLRAKSEDVDKLLSDLTTEVEKNIDELRQTHVSDTETYNTKLNELSIDIREMIDALRQELLGDVPVAAYDTFTELAEYIAEHEEVSEALTAAIGNKADASVVESQATQIANLENAVESNATGLGELQNSLGSLASKSEVTEGDLDAELKAKVNAASEGNHSHSNKDVLDSITADTVDGWDNKTSMYIGSEQPTTSETNYIWFHISE